MRNCAIAAGSALVSAVIGVIVIIAVLGDPAAPKPENPRSTGTPEAAATDANAWHRQCLGAEGAWVHEGVNALIRDQLPNPASFTHERTIASLEPLLYDGKYLVIVGFAADTVLKERQRGSGYGTVDASCTVTRGGLGNPQPNYSYSPPRPADEACRIARLDQQWTVDIITTWGDHPEHHRRLAKANTEIGATCLAAVPDAAPSGPGGGGLDVIELVGVGPTTDTIELSWGDWIAAASVEGNEYIEGQAYIFVVDLHGYENGGTVQIANEVASDTITSQALRVGRDIAAGPVLVVVTVAEGARWAVLLTRV